MNHVAFHAASRDQVDTLTAGVRDRPDASLLCEDPAGIKVEIVGPEAGPS